MREFIGKLLSSLNRSLNSEVHIMSTDDNENVRFMKSYIYFVIIHIIIVSYSYVAISYYSENYTFLLKFGLKNVVLLSLLISSIAALIFYKRMAKIQVVNHKKMEGIPDYVKGIDYYRYLLPLCVLCTSLLCFSLNTIDFKFVAYGVLFLLLFILLIIIFAILEGKVYENLFYTVNISSYICDDLTINERTPLKIKKFNEYFKHTLDNVDSKLNRNLKINQLEKKGSISIKYVLSNYLPLYIEYCSNEQLGTFKDNVSVMRNYVDNNGNIISLDIINKINLIYDDLLSFFENYNLNITKKKTYYSYISDINYPILLVVVIFLNIIPFIYNRYSESLNLFVDSMPSSTWIIAGASLLSAIIVGSASIVATIIKK